MSLHCQFRSAIRQNLKYAKELICHSYTIAMIILSNFCAFKRYFNISWEFENLRNCAGIVFHIGFEATFSETTIFWSNIFIACVNEEATKRVCCWSRKQRCHESNSIYLSSGIFCEKSLEISFPDIERRQCWERKMKSIVHLTELKCWFVIQLTKSPTK